MDSTMEQDALSHDGEVSQTEGVSPRLRLKKTGSTRSEFPDSGPEMAQLRVRSLTMELLSDDENREALERELDWLERTHPLPAVLGLLQAMNEGDESLARMASILLKNLVSRIGGWQQISETLRLQVVSALFQGLGLGDAKSSDNVGRVLATICDVEGAAFKQRIVDVLCREASQGHVGACNAMRFLGPATLRDYRDPVIQSLCQALFAISSAHVADARIMQDLCDVLVTCAPGSQRAALPSQFAFSSDMLCAAITFGARACPAMELRARALEVFPQLWQASREGVQKNLLARAAREAMALDQDDLILVRASEFWTSVASDKLAEIYLDSVLDAAIELISQKWLVQPLEDAVRKLLVALVGRRGECADALAMCMEGVFSEEEARERYMVLICIGALCHSEWISPSEGPAFALKLISAASNEDDSAVHGASLWALEQSCWKGCDVFYATPGDFGRLMQSLLRLLTSSNEEIARVACGCLRYVLEHDQLVAAGRLTEPHKYAGELGRVPAFCSKTNRFSSYFSSLVESLSTCVAVTDASRVTALLIESCANDILGFVSWVLNRQIRALWGRVSANSGLVSGRKRAWGGVTSPRSTAAAASSASASPSMTDLSPGTSNAEAMRSVSPSSPPAHHRHGLKSRISVESACIRMKACIERLTRVEREDPVLWKVSGEAANVLGRIFISEPENRVFVMDCLREIAHFRGDLDLSAIVQEELTVEDEPERVICALGLCFVLTMVDPPIFDSIERRASRAHPPSIRCAAVRAMAEFIVERNRRCGDGDALIPRLSVAAFDLLLCVDEALLSSGRGRDYHEPSLVFALEDEAGEDSDALDTVWQILGACAEAYQGVMNATLPPGASTFPEMEELFARHVSDMIAHKAAPACKYLPFHEGKTGVAMRCLAMIVRAGGRFSARLREDLFEARYEEIGPVFDVIASALAGKEAAGEAAHKAGKVASDALFLVFPKGTFQ